MAKTTDYDVLIVGSGFGGSVSAHRLSQKGYRVAVVEQGRRYRTADLPRTTWDLRRYLWMPMLKMFGIFSISVFKDMVIFHGAGVGAAPLVYANTHLEPPEAFFKDPKWAGLADWQRELAPHYAEARRMLGSVEAPRLYASDEALREVLTEMGQGHTFKKHTVGVFFGEAGKQVEDPYFGGEGPARTGCTQCGGCMVGCRVGAKNTLDKNYLYFAEKQGTEVVPERRVTDIRPLEGGGYAVATVRSTAWFRKQPKTYTAQRVILSAGALGSTRLLFACRERGSLPHVSEQLGSYVRTNSESIQGINRYGEDIGQGIAITSGGHTPDGTHIEMFRYGPAADAMSGLTTVHVPGGPLPRQVYFLGELLKRPWLALRRLLWPFGWSKSLAGVLAMQSHDNSMYLRWKRRWWWPFGKALSSDWGDRPAPPTFLPEAHDVTVRVARKLKGQPGSVTPEVLLDTTTTAHILGGCPMGQSPADGVIDKDHQVFGHPGLYVVDGAAVCANLGVNPSLTITAMAERAMEKIPARAQALSQQAVPAPV